MKKALLIILFYSSSFSGFGQIIEKSLIKRNNAYLSIGDFSMLGFNYERILKINTKSMWGLKAGLAMNIVPHHQSYLPNEVLFGFGYNLGLFYLLPHRNLKNHWEIGIHNSTLIQQERDGGSRVSFTSGQPIVLDSAYYYKSLIGSIGPRVSFRHQRPQGGFFYKIGLTLGNLNYFRDYDNRKYYHNSKPFYNKFPVPELAFGWTF